MRTPLPGLHLTNGIGMLDHLPIVPLAELERDLTTAARVMHTDVLVLLGGEPLLHKDLVPLMRFAKASGIAETIRVLTNGLRLHRMGDDFWTELEDLKVSIYPGKTPTENVELAKAMAGQYGFALSFYDVASDPFKTVHTSVPHTPERAQEVFNACWYKTFTRKLERGHFYRCCTSPSISQQLLGLPPDHDGIPLEGLTADGLAVFLNRREYMDSCTRCLGHTGPVIQPWGEQRDKTRWLTDSAR